jgi:hypothetical protein
VVSVNLEEAIQHAKEKACTIEHKECAKDHAQLAIWLEDYKKLLSEKLKDRGNYAK